MQNTQLETLIMSIDSWDQSTTESVIQSIINKKRDYQTFLKYYKASEHPEHWIELWKIIIKQKSYENFIKNVISILSDADLLTFIIPLINDQPNIISMTEISTKILWGNCHIDLIESLLNQVNPHDKKALSKQLLIDCFTCKRMDVLDCLSSIDSSFNLVDSLLSMHIAGDINLDIEKILSISSQLKESQQNTFIIDLLRKISPIEYRLDLYKKLILLSYQKYNIPLLKKLNAEIEFNSCIADWDAIDLNQLSNFLTVDESKAYYIRDKMVNFAKGFGHITYNDSLLTLAQRKERKTSYVFDPVIINYSELDDLLKCLFDAPKPLCQRFIISDAHFICGEIYIESNMHEAKLLLIDSLGANAIDQEILIKFVEKFPKNELFVLDENRIRNGIGCSIYALDDVAHLFNLHLENDADVWTYLSAQKSETNKVIINLDTEDQNFFYVCKTPLTLARTMRSQSLLTEVIPSRTSQEQDLTVNKKGKNAKDSVMPFFKVNPSGKRQNTRLDYKLSKIIQHNLKFLEKHTPQYIENAMQFFTLNGLKARIMLQKTQTNEMKRNLQLLKQQHEDTHNEDIKNTIHRGRS